MKSLKGQLILDPGKLQGSFFHRSVVLVCQHDAEGAFGLVLNRVLPNKIGDVLVANLPDVLKKETLYLGGPVQPQALSYLYNDAFIPDANVIPNLTLGHSLDGLLDIGDSFSPEKKIRVFAGYAGWSAGQLDDEMKRETWMLHPATLDVIFHAEPEKLWNVILSEKGWKYRLLAEGPEDLSWN
jgi:putative transcriptional regulator